MLWRASTYGEEVFLDLYRNLGAGISVNAPDGIDFLLSASRFQEFTRLAATLEVFFRCIRSARHFHQTQAHMSSNELGKKLRQDADLPPRLYNDRGFCEAAKQAGRIAAEKPRLPSIEANALRNEPSQCYICGINLVSLANARNQSSAEHLWPLSLGGQTVEENILPACKDCNEKRGQTVTWAWGPVQSTFHTKQPNKNPPGPLLISLAIANLMLVAGRNGRKLLTLKEAAKQTRPILPSLVFDEDQSYLYFEMFQQFEALT